MGYEGGLSGCEKKLPAIPGDASEVEVLVVVGPLLGRPLLT